MKKVQWKKFMIIYIINGPNLNMLGLREPSIYGTKTYFDLVLAVKQKARQLKVKIKFFQTNEEGKIINYLHKAYFRKIDGIIINPGGYSHYSVAIYDALKASQLPTVEVHLSDISKREDFRKKSLTGEACLKTFMGEGINSYLLALEFLVGELNV